MVSILDAIWETRLNKEIERRSQSERGGPLYYLMPTIKVHETLQLEGREVHYLGSNPYSKETLKTIWYP